MNENETSSGSVIELSTVHFYKGELERTIALKDVGLMLGSGIPAALSALYGHQSKQDGFMSAGQHADRHGLQFTVIDFLVRLDHKVNVGVMKPEELIEHDFLNFQRSSRAMLNEIDIILSEKLVRQGTLPDSVFAGKPHLLVIERPELVASLLSDSAMAHLKVLVHGARTQFSERPLNVGTVPFTQWRAIQEATCRLNPETRITLELPSLTDKPGRSDRSKSVAKPSLPRSATRPRSN